MATKAEKIITETIIDWTKGLLFSGHMKRILKSNGASIDLRKNSPNGVYMVNYKGKDIFIETQK